MLMISFVIKHFTLAEAFPLVLSDSLFALLAFCVAPKIRPTVLQGHIKRVLRVWFVTI